MKRRRSQVSGVTPWLRGGQQQQQQQQRQRQQQQQQPTPNSQQPTTNNQQPTTNNQQPTTTITRRRSRRRRDRSNISKEQHTQLGCKDLRFHDVVIMAMRRVAKKTYCIILIYYIWYSWFQYQWLVENGSLGLWCLTWFGHPIGMDRKLNSALSFSRSDTEMQHDK